MSKYLYEYYLRQLRKYKKPITFYSETKQYTAIPKKDELQTYNSSIEG